MEPYPESFFRALNDWLKGSRKKKKKARVLIEQLKEHCDGTFCYSAHRCFRKINLINADQFDLFREGQLSEQISSWTTDLNVAKSFKVGVPNDEAFLGVIVGMKPTPDRIVLNIADLVQSNRFRQSLAEFLPLEFTTGILEFGYSQSEVILDVDSFTLGEDIESFGGHVGTMEQLRQEATLQLGYEPSVIDLTQRLTQFGFEPGQSSWLSKSSTTRVVESVLQIAKGRGLFGQPEDASFKISL